MIALSATTGIVDAVSVLGLGRVFTANMTGNIIFLGVAAVGAPGFSPPLYLWALATFMIGAIAGGRIGKHAQGYPLRRWLAIAATVETVLLWLAAFVVLHYDVKLPASFGLYATIALTALAMGFRNATVRLLKVADMTTTVLTLTITGLAADSTLGGGDNSNWRRRIASVAAIFAGVVLGAVLTLHGHLAAPLLVAGAVILVSSLLCALRLPS